jgi:hypothetical protein
VGREQEGKLSRQPAHDFDVGDLAVGREVEGGMHLGLCGAS